MVAAATLFFFVAMDLGWQRAAKEAQKKLQHVENEEEGTHLKDTPTRKEPVTLRRKVIGYILIAAFGIGFVGFILLLVNTFFHFVDDDLLLALIGLAADVCILCIVYAWRINANAHMNEKKLSWYTNGWRLIELAIFVFAVFHLLFFVLPLFNIVLIGSRGSILLLVYFLVVLVLGTWGIVLIQGARHIQPAS